jgi:hypothetical protein
MKQLTVDVLTSILVLVNFFTGILSFVPIFFFPNPLNAVLPIDAWIVSIGLMVLASVMDVMVSRSRLASIIIICVFGLAYWMVTPNVLLLAVFVGVIAFGQIVLKE